MELESYLDYSEPGQIRLRGHRIDLATIVKLYQEGYSPELIAHTYQTLSLEAVYGAITFYLHNQTEIDAYVREGDAQAEREYQEYLRGPQNPAMDRIRRLVAQRHQEQRG